MSDRPEAPSLSENITAAYRALSEGRDTEAFDLVADVDASSSDIADALHIRGIALFRRGDHRGGLECLRSARDVAPERADLLNTLGLVLRTFKSYDEAILVLREAVDRDPALVDAWNNLGIALAESNRLEDAEKTYLKAIEVKPEFPEALNNLGNIHGRRSRFEQALECYDKALASKPDYPEAWSNRGDALEGLGKDRFEDALKSYDRALELSPALLPVMSKRASILFRMEKFEEAEKAFAAAIRAGARDVRTLCNAAACLEKRFKLWDAATLLRHALSIAPDDVAALKSLGHIALKMGEVSEARALLEKARSIAPADPDIIYSLGNVFLRLERLEDAFKCYMRVRELQPNAARGTFAPAAVLLMDGQFEKGWAAYESRFGMPGFRTNVPNLAERLWRGEPLDGKRILVHVEQGFGDSIQFIRFVEVLKAGPAKDAHVILLCEPELARLLGTAPGVDEVHHQGEKVEIAFDFQIPLLSLPDRLKIGAEGLAPRIPYLSLIEGAGKELDGRVDAHLKVGFVWAGRPSHSDDFWRSVQLRRFADLFDIEEIDFHSLQWGPRAGELKPYLERPNVFDATAGLKDFADTAAVLSRLDLLISIDTSTAHLAGALGKAVWILIPYGGEWRWFKRTVPDTPWYPSARLVRQEIVGSWDIPFERVREGLLKALEEKKSG